MLSFINIWNEKMKKILPFACFFVLVGCTSIHEKSIQDIDCIGVYTLGSFPYQQKVKLKLSQKHTDKLGRVTYKAGSNLGVRFVGRGIIKETEIKILHCNK